MATALSDRIAAIREKTAPNTVRPSYRLSVQKVVVILTSSRSGSSMFKEVLLRHPEIVALPGEEEPFHFLLGNHAPWQIAGLGDSFNRVDDPAMLARYIERELLLFGNSGTRSVQDWAAHWKRRILMQIDFDLSADLIEHMLRTEPTDALFLEALLGRHFSGLYDATPHRSPFIGDFKVEEPPFVSIPSCVVYEPEIHGPKVLLFKTPQNAYRIGLFEQLYPNAEIKYIHLTRGAAQTINGLIDGWECNYGFFAHDLHDITDLAIGGYSERYTYGDRWWKFDLPPGWTAYRDKPLEEVCAFQWLSAHDCVLKSAVKPLRVKFEELFGPNRYALFEEIRKFIGLTASFNVTAPLRNVMSTEPPSPFRWHKRKDVIMGIMQSSCVKRMMGDLEYSMDPRTWL